MPVVVGSVGLGAETSYWQFKQRQMQTAVDMAAYTGAVSLRNNEALSKPRTRQPRRPSYIASIPPSVH